MEAREARRTGATRRRPLAVRRGREGSAGGPRDPRRSHASAADFVGILRISVDLQGFRRNCLDFTWILLGFY